MYEINGISIFDLGEVFDHGLINYFTKSDIKVYDDYTLEIVKNKNLNEAAEDPEIIIRAEICTNKLAERLTAQGDTFRAAKEIVDEELSNFLEKGSSFRLENDDTFIKFYNKKKERVEKIELNKYKFWEQYSFGRMLDAIKTIISKSITNVVSDGKIIRFENPLIYLFCGEFGQIEEILNVFDVDNVEFYSALFRVIIEAVKNEDGLKLQYGMGAALSRGGIDLENLPWEEVEKTIILTEGVSDARLINLGLILLKPHVRHLYKFMNADAKAERNAGALVKLTKSLIAANSEQRFISIFDNDLAAKSARSALNKIKYIPDNFKIKSYPDLEIFNNYPTVNQNGEFKEENINGKACSIEMYGGLDILKNDIGSLIPIQWKGDYDNKLEGYQGEVKEKKKVQKRFIEKLKVGDPNSDWDAMNKLLDTIIYAFEDN